jgi:hypothetical protein
VCSSSFEPSVVLATAHTCDTYNTIVPQHVAVWQHVKTHWPKLHCTAATRCATQE